MKRNLILILFVFAKILHAQASEKVKGGPQDPISPQEGICENGHLSFEVQEQNWKIYVDGALICQQGDCFRLKREAPEAPWVWRNESLANITDETRKTTIFTLSQVRGFLPNFKGMGPLLWKNDSENGIIALGLHEKELQIQWSLQDQKVFVEKDSQKWSFSGLGSQRDFRTHRRIVRMTPTLLASFDEKGDTTQKKAPRAVAQNSVLLKCEDDPSQL